MIHQYPMPFGSKLMEGLLTLFFFIIIFFILIINIQLFGVFAGDSPIQEDCTSKRCSDDGPIIQFPFRLRDQPKSCGYQGFELYCRRSGETMLKLPFSVEFFVRDIDYQFQVLIISDPNDCLPRLLLDLNLSSSPFSLQIPPLITLSNYDTPFPYREAADFKLFNCLTMISSDDQSFLAPCLSTDLPGYFYLIGNIPLERVSSSNCRAVISDPVSLSFSYSHVNYPFQNLKMLYLGWSQPSCGDCYSSVILCRRRCYFLEVRIPDCNWSGKLCRLNGRGDDTTECVTTPSISVNSANTPTPSISVNSAYTPKGSNVDTVSTKKKNVKNVIIGLCVATFVVIVAMVVLLIFKKSKAKKKREQGVKIEKFLEEYKALKPTRYSYAEIRKITKCFKSKLGQGSYGNVFKGKLSNGIWVAVKVLKSPTVNGEKFINEMGTIGRIHHINVVRLLGFCIEGSKQALVYEFMQNESLEKLIFIQEDQSPLFSWRKLQEIAIGIARGMEYLHQGCDQRILHFDIKPHNILLDHKFTPKISDFGLAKLCSKEKSIVSMSTARGTMGYIAPEIFLRNFKTVSHKSDVYSFGMLLLEMVGGRKNNDTSRGDDNQTYFPEWIYNQLAQGEELGLRIEQAEDFEIAKKLTITALWCIQWSPNDRPTMTAVIHMLEGSFESLSLPPNPFSSCIEREKIRASTNISQESNLPVITE